MRRDEDNDTHRLLCPDEYTTCEDNTLHVCVYL